MNDNMSDINAGPPPKLVTSLKLDSQPPIYIHTSKHTTAFLMKQSSKTEPRSSKQGILGGVLAGAVGALGWVLWQGHQAKQWPQIQGKVLITPFQFFSNVTLTTTLTLTTTPTLHLLCQVMGWKISGNLMSPIAEMTYMYEV